MYARCRLKLFPAALSLALLSKSDCFRSAARNCCLVAAASVVAGSELIATLSNVQWYLCILSLLLLLITVPRLEIGLTIVQVCIAFTAPLTLLYVPFLLWQATKNRAALKLRPIIHLLALFGQAWIMRQDVSSGPKRIFQLNSLFLATLSSGLSRCVALAPPRLQLSERRSRRCSVCHTGPRCDDWIRACGLTRVASFFARQSLNGCSAPPT